MRMVGISIVLLVALGLPSIAVALPSVTPLDEMVVNTYTINDQRDPKNCRDAGGNHVIVWESHGQDGDPPGIFGQRFRPDGTPAGTEFQVNTYTRDDQEDPDVCCDAAGDFVVAWRSSNQDGGNRGVFSQRFKSDGAPQGTEFQVNTYTYGSQDDVVLSCDPNGNFVALWDSDRQDGSDRGIFGQRYTSSGLPNGTEFQVNTYTPNDQEEPAVCCDTAGNFVVVWQAAGGQDGDSDGVFGQRYKNDGSPQGTEFQVNTYTVNDQGAPALSCDAQGNFIVVWESEQDGDDNGVFARRFQNTGAPSGTEFQVNTYTTGLQEEPAVCCDATGNAVVAWESENQDGDGVGVFARRIATNGVSSAEFQVNTYTSNDQTDPDLACGPDGDFMVKWRSERQDGSGDAVIARLFRVVHAPSAPALGPAGLALSGLGLIGIGAWRLARRRRRRS